MYIYYILLLLLYLQDVVRNLTILREVFANRFHLEVGVDSVDTYFDGLGEIRTELFLLILDFNLNLSESLRVIY